MSRKIVAIGGGRVRMPAGRVPQTRCIDEEIHRLSGRKHPRLLFIPTASVDDPAYCEAIDTHFGAGLGCRVSRLLLYRERPPARCIRDLIRGADIIYVGGGNTLRMLPLWRRLGIDGELIKAWKRGAVMSGLSAGAICWFRQGNSDSRKFADASNDTLIRVSGLGLVDTLICPHYDVEKHRKAALKSMMKSTRGVAIALDNGAAIEIIDSTYRVLTSLQRKNAWKVYWHRGQYYREKLPRGDAFLPLGELLGAGPPAR